MRRIFIFLRRAAQRPRYVWQIIAGFSILMALSSFRKKPITLVRRYSGIGDIICTLPSVVMLKRNNPNAIIVYETRHDYMSLVRCCEYIDLVVEENSLLAEHLPRAFKPKLLLHPLLPDEQKPPGPRKRIHLSEEFRKCFGLEELAEKTVRLKVCPCALRQVRLRLKQERLCDRSLVIIHTGPTWKVKEWPEKNWTDLAGQLKSKKQVVMIQIGADITPYGEKRKAHQVTGVKSWIGTLTLDQTLALLSIAQLFVGVDSGMLHLAGAVRTSCVGIFGPTAPDCFLPCSDRAIGVTANVSCLGCHHCAQGPAHWQTGCNHKIRCMSELSVDTVYLACQRLLNDGRRFS